jgi:uncharacterized OB-fold protein
MTTEAQIPVMRCEDCEALFIPPQYVCRKCSSTNLSNTDLNCQGTIYTFTTIRVAPEELKDQAPYRIVVVELCEGLRVTARLSGDQEAPIKIGQALTFDKVDGQGYWFHAEPISSSKGK